MEKDLENFSWLLVYTKAKQEKRAKVNLENQGIETFLPMVAYQKISKSKSISLEPMFPGYLFITINAETDNWAHINSTKGVSHLVMFGDKFAEVPNSVVAFLKTRLDDNDIVKQKITRQAFQKGDKIIIKSGILKGKKATFLAKTGKERARILLKLMNELIITDVPGHDVGRYKAIIETFKL